MKSFSVAYPVNAQVSSLFEFGYTITKSGAVFSHGGGAVGNRKGIVTGKNWGLSIAVGRMASNCTVEEVDKFVQGGTWGASLYRGIGGGIATNSLGTAFETGFGFGCQAAAQGTHVQARLLLSCWACLFAPLDCIAPLG